MEENTEIDLDLVPKFFTLNKVFIIAVFFICAMYYDTRDYVDLCYLGLVVFYYVRIKIFRWQRYH